MRTQAHELDALMDTPPREKRVESKIISITSGKGGVGKSTISANLSYCLWRMGYKVAVFDADIGLANLDVIFGVKKVEKNILHTLKGEAKIGDIIIPIESGLYLIPGESGEEILKYSDQFLMEAFYDEISILDSLDFMIIDTGAGIGGHIQSFLNASDDVIVVTIPDPAAITDAYTMIKIISKDKPKIKMIMNMTKNEKEATSIFEKISTITKQHVSNTLKLEFLGKIDQDTTISRAIKQRSLFVKQNPNSSSTNDIEVIAKRLASSMEHNVLKVGEERRFGRFFKKILGQF